MMKLGHWVKSWQISHLEAGKSWSYLLALIQYVTQHQEYSYTTVSLSLFGL